MPPFPGQGPKDLPEVTRQGSKPHGPAHLRATSRCQWQGCALEQGGCSERAQPEGLGCAAGRAVQGVSWGQEEGSWGPGWGQGSVF